MQTIVLILVLAITVEALIQYGKTILEMLEKKQYKTFATQLAAILISVFICFAAGVNLYALVGVSFTVPWLGTLLTGIVVSRGSNYTSDFIKRLQNPDIGEIVLEDVIGVADDAGKAEALTFTVKDAYGNPVTGLKPDAPVFSGAASTGSERPSAGNWTEKGNGVYVATLTLGSAAGVCDAASERPKCRCSATGAERCR